MKISANTKKTLDIVAPLSAAAFVAYTFYKKDKNDLQTAGIAALFVFVIGYIIVSQLTKALLVATINNVSMLDKEKIGVDYNISMNEIDNAFEIAKEVHIALHGEDGNAWTEDETRAVNALKTITTANLAQAVSAAYKKQYNKSLASDVKSYVHSWNGYYQIPNVVRDNWF